MKEFKLILNDDHSITIVDEEGSGRELTWDAHSVLAEEVHFAIEQGF